MSARLIEGKLIASRIESDLEEELSALRAAGTSPGLVTIQVGTPPASELYIQRQQRGFERIGIPYRIERLPPETGQEALLERIDALNRDPETTGIMLQMPLPDAICPRTARQAILPAKDVEGVHPENLGYLLSGRPSLVPCTAAAVLEAIRHTGLSLPGAEAVVVGHSETVGRPVALLLMERMATVTVCHKATRDLLDHTRRAELLVVAVGKAGLIPPEGLREGAVLVDVGINRTGEGAKPRVVGDIDAAGAAARGSWRTPVPGGIGPITVAMLMRNTVRAAAGRGTFED